MVLYADLAHDSRVRREAEALVRAGHHVRLVSLGGTDGTPDLPTGVDVLVRKPQLTSALPGPSNPYIGLSSGRLPRRIRQARWLVDYVRNLRTWGREAIETCGPVDIWHANDLPGLVAIEPELGRGAPVIYDSHEIFPDAGTSALLPAAVRALMRRYEGYLVAQVAAVVTVNEPFAHVLRQRYRPKRLVVVHNAPARWYPPRERPDELRRALGQHDRPVVLYHGVFAGDRGLIQLAQAMLAPGLERAHLVYLGFGVMTDELAALALEARFDGRIHVLPAVSLPELPRWIASADVVAMPIQPATLNHRLTTPNKLLEALAAGSPVVASDTPGMSPIVRDDPDGPLGETCDPSDPSSIADAIRRILELDRSAYEDLRSRCLKAAHARWNWETESAKLTALYAEVAE